MQPPVQNRMSTTRGTMRPAARSLMISRALSSPSAVTNSGLKKSLTDAEGLEGSAGDGKQAAALRLEAVEGRIAQPGQVHRLFPEHLAQLPVGQHAVDGAGHLFGLDFELSGDAGADVDDPGFPAPPGLDETADGHHGGNDPGEVFEQLGIVPLDEVDDGRTVGRYQRGCPRGGRPGARYSSTRSSTPLAPS